MRGLRGARGQPETRDLPGAREPRQQRGRRLAAQTATRSRHAPPAGQGAGRDHLVHQERADLSGRQTSSVGARPPPVKGRVEPRARAPARSRERHVTPRAPKGQAGPRARALTKDRAMPRVPNGDRGPRVPAAGEGRQPAPTADRAPDAPRDRAGPAGRPAPIPQTTAQPGPAGRPAPIPQTTAQPGPAGRPAPTSEAATEPQATARGGPAGLRLRPGTAGRRRRRPGPARAVAPGRLPAALRAQPAAQAPPRAVRVAPGALRAARGPTHVTPRPPSLVPGTPRPVAPPRPSRASQGRGFRTRSAPSSSIR